ncbi:MAG: hypothetical protein V1755_06760 [Chloroflexota bacterium]
MQVAPGATDVSVDIRAMTAAGVALTGKVAADFTAWYRRDGAKMAIALSDLAALTTAHTNGGLKEIGDGWYRLDVPDAAFAAGANRAAIGGTVDGGVLLSAPVVINNDVFLADGYHGGLAATLTLKNLRLVNSAGNAITLEATGGHGIYALVNGANCHGAYLRSVDSNGLVCEGAEYGINAISHHASLAGIRATGHWGILGIGAGSDGAGILATGGTDAHGFFVLSAGAGYDLYLGRQKENLLTDIKGTGWSDTTDTLKEIRDAIDAGGGTPSAEAVADAVLDELLATHAIAGSAGAALSAAGGAIKNVEMKTTETRMGSN